MVNTFNMYMKWHFIVSSGRGVPDRWLYINNILRRVKPLPVFCTTNPARHNIIYYIICNIQCTTPRLPYKVTVHTGVGFLYNFFPSLLLYFYYYHSRSLLSNEYLAHQSDYVGLRETDLKEQIRSGWNNVIRRHCADDVDFQLHIR